MRKILAMVVVAAMLTTGCASAAGPRMAIAQQPGGVPAASMGEYVQRLPTGSKVKVERTDGSSLKGTLMKAGADTIVVQKNTRVPEPPIEIPVAQIARVTIDSGTSTGKAVGIGIASGVGAFFAILAILAATFDD